MTQVSPPSPRRHALYRTVRTRNLAAVSRVFRVRPGQRSRRIPHSLPRNPWLIPPQRARTAIFAGASLVEPTGIEPVTSCLQTVSSSDLLLRQQEVLECGTSHCGG